VTMEYQYSVVSWLLIFKQLICQESWMTSLFA